MRRGARQWDLVSGAPRTSSHFLSACPCTPALAEVTSSAQVESDGSWPPHPTNACFLPQGEQNPLVMSPSNLQRTDSETIPHSSSEGPSRMESQSPTGVTGSPIRLASALRPPPHFTHPSSLLTLKWKVPEGQYVSCSLVPENFRLLSPWRAWSLRWNPALGWGWGGVCLCLDSPCPRHESCEPGLHCPVSRMEQLDVSDRAGP